jgi:hypothetical protein
MEFREAMEERNFDPEEIELKVAEVRQKLLNEVGYSFYHNDLTVFAADKLSSCWADFGKLLQELKVKDSEPNLSETHARAEAKDKEAKKFASALGIRDGRYLE